MVEQAGCQEVMWAGLVNWTVVSVISDQYLDLKAGCKGETGGLTRVCRGWSGMRLLPVVLGSWVLCMWCRWFKVCRKQGSRGGAEQRQPRCGNQSPSPPPHPPASQPSHLNPQLPNPPKHPHPPSRGHAQRPGRRSCGSGAPAWGLHEEGGWGLGVWWGSF